MDKTESLTSNNIIRVALDDGSGNISCRFINSNGEIKESYKPSIISSDEIFTANCDNPDYVWITNGNTYSVTSSNELVNTCNKHYQTSDANRVLINDTMADAGLGGQKIQLGCTLPTNIYYNVQTNKVSKNIDAIAAKIESLKIPCENKYASKSTPIVTEIKVYPEAIPAIFHVAIKDGQLDPDIVTKENTLVIDLGRYTADLALLGPMPSFNIKGSDTQPLGVQSLIDEIRNVLTDNKDKIGINFNLLHRSDSFIEEKLKTKQIEIVFRENDKPVKKVVDISAYINQALDNIANRIKSYVLSLCKNDIDSIDNIILVGGGAYYFKDKISSWHPSIICDLEKKPELAIVRGLHTLMENNK